MASPVLRQAMKLSEQMFMSGPKTPVFCKKLQSTMNIAFWASNMSPVLEGTEYDTVQTLALTAKRGSLCRRAHVSLAEAGVSSE